MRVEITLPVHNEAQVLPQSLPRLLAFVREELPAWQVGLLIADNGSTDGTGALAARMAAEHPEVRTWSMHAAGRGGALRRAWLEGEADVLAYMDVDLSTDLAALPPLLEAVRGGAGLAVGSRLLPGSEVVGRPPQRELLSRGYSALVRALFRPPVRDLQCGFKAIERSAARALVPTVLDDGWFFDTELILQALAAGHRVDELPVRWVDDPDTRVRVLPTVWGDLRGLARLRAGGLG